MFDPARLVRLSGAFLVYQAVALFFFGSTLLFHFSDFHAGSGPDPQFMLWSVAWWPYALSHHVNPLFSRLVWAPEGFDVVWSTSINLQSLLAAPITLRWGPVVSLNLLALTMPALTALSGFILASRLVGKLGPALLGGYLYGFSPFMVGHQAGAHIVLTSAFMIPAIILLTLNRLDDRIGARAFVLLLSFLLVCQFLMALELLGTIGLFGTTALVIAWIIWPERRARLQSTAALIAVALLLAALAFSPMLVHVLTESGVGRHRVWTDNGADLFELIVPGKFFLVGRSSAGVAARRRTDILRATSAVMSACRYCSSRSFSAMRDGSSGARVFWLRCSRSSTSRRLGRRCTFAGSSSVRCRGSSSASCP